jgi:hypothetical protein
VAHDLVTDVSSGGRAIRWPTLLYLAAHRSHLRAPLLEVWARVLTVDVRLAPNAHRILQIWAGYAEGEPEVVAAFARMVRGVAAIDRRAGAVLIRLARQWRDDGALKPLPQVAQAVLANGVECHPGKEA